jgi:pyruvate formate lyase activating enzyme
MRSDSRLRTQDSRLLPGRRTFLKTAVAPCLMAAGGGCGMFSVQANPSSLTFSEENDARFIVEARYYEKLPFKKVKCKLCPRECVIDDRERGYCGVRENRDGVYYTLVHSRVCASHVDPIEKKPFFHFRPGTMAFSLATAGCNVNCKMCQNWEISQSRPEQVRNTYLPPKELAGLARGSDCVSIAYTYSEPIVFFEYMIDAAKATRAAGLKNTVVTGGFIQKEPLLELCRHVDAIKVDLKAFSEKYYREIVNGELKPVQQALSVMRQMGMWTEIVYLLIPTLNDGDQELRDLARWVKAELGLDVPVHFTRFYPQYLLKNLPSTPLTTLERAKAIADAEGLHFVYIGNVPGHPAENTYCPQCKKAVVERDGFAIQGLHIRDGRCAHCRQTIAGVWGT